MRSYLLSDGVPVLLAAVWLLGGAVPAAGVDANDTRLVADPAVCAEAIAFAYANDLWTARLDGSGVRRLTSQAGVESRPSFSPDGSWIAFTGRYEGNTDVYVVAREGGMPRRLTWHPGPDLALGFTPDGKSVLFSSARQVHDRRHTQLFTIPLEGGVPTRLPIPYASQAAISPDGRTIAYVPLAERFRQWKNYRGGTVGRVLLFDVATLEVQPVPQPEGRCNDSEPMWVGDTLFFLSDREGEFNLYRFDRDSKAIRRVTNHQDYPVLHASSGAGRIAYEQSGYLHLFDPGTGVARRLSVGVAADLAEPRPRWAGGAKWIRSLSLSPSGVRVAVEYRGEILTLPREKGDDRNLTSSPGVHERSPQWSPDGRWIACFSDAGGEYALHLLPQDGKGEIRTIPIGGPGFYENPRWSPDSRWICFTDNSQAIRIVEVATGNQREVTRNALYGPDPKLHHAWSPDSRWLAYTRASRTYFNQVFLYSVAEDRSYPVTDGLADTTAPVFDANGKYLYFLVSTDSGPINDWFSQANADLRSVQQVYLAVLAEGVPSPLARESDEETPKPESPNAEEEEAKTKEDTAKPGRATPPEVRFDPARIAERILALPVDAGVYADLSAGATNQLFYRRAASTDPGADFAVFRYDLTRRKEDRVLDKADGLELSADHRRAVVRVGEALYLVDVGDKFDLTKFKLNVDRVKVHVDPRSEWPQIFQEAWRINRDYFYDPTFHGADWPAIREKYAGFLPDLGTRDDLFRVIQWMLSELSVGHSYQSPGDRPEEGETVPGGLLGADLDIDQGRYRFQKVLGGLNWNPDLRSPLTEPGVEVRTGEYLLAVDGRDLRPPDNLFRRLERTADRRVELLVGPTPDGAGARTVTVVPVRDEGALRKRDWIEGNLRRVTEATQGRVAYVYVPNTAGLGHEYFKRYFFPQADRQAIIIDERHNGGGSIADYYIDILRRPVVSYWAMRYGPDLKTPIAAIHGPKAMLIDETAGSGGDLLPWMFRKYGLGPLIGKRTWGGLVGILGFPPLMDGGSVTAPNLAFWTEEGFRVENEGVAPDLEVELTPKEVAAGRDPQLEKAIETVLKALDRESPTAPGRPPYPVRVHRTP